MTCGVKTITLATVQVQQGTIRICQELREYDEGEPVPGLKFFTLDGDALTRERAYALLRDLWLKEKVPE